MMPVATISTEIPKAKRPKIGFSIDSIVGNCESKQKSEIDSQSPSPIHYHNHQNHHHSPRSETSSPLPGSPTPTSTEQQSNLRRKHSHCEVNSRNSSRTNSPTNESEPLTSITNGPPPPGLQFPHLPHNPHGLSNFNHPHHPGGLGATGLPPWMHGPSHHGPPGLLHPNPSHPMYPWFLARQARFFQPRFGPGPEFPGFLLHPFRKPKRIRTAFSPSQLLKLEHAFEKNHYVVGAERKQLAKLLSLTETQVKVWFQNRRTKHKRMETEDEETWKGGSGNNHGGNSQSPANPITADSSTSHHDQHSRKNYDESEDEEILMDEEDDLCLSDEEAEQRERERVFREQLQRNRLDPLD